MCERFLFTIYCSVLLTGVKRHTESADRVGVLSEEIRLSVDHVARERCENMGKKLNIGSIVELSFSRSIDDVWVMETIIATVLTHFDVRYFVSSIQG